MSDILIVTAHLDDFELGMGGTAGNIAKDNNVTVVTLCRGDRPGYESVFESRVNACKANVEELGFNLITFQYSDTKLDTIPQTELCNIIYNIILDETPDTVYTHYDRDVHRDHQLVSNAVRVSCRMRESSPVNNLYEFSIPGSTEWGFDMLGFNKFVNVIDTYQQKLTMISRYTTELREAPDPVSLDMIAARDSYHGSICGYQKAEAFKIVFQR